jgi:hypothetical protein
MATNSTNGAQPAEPPKEQAYETASNQVSKEPAEKHTTAANDETDRVLEKRGPHDQSTSSDDAQPAPLAKGVHGGHPSGDHVTGGETVETSAPKMAPAGEGRVAEAEKEKPGATGAQPDLASDIDRYDCFW